MGGCTLILLDTHALVWLDQGLKLLGPTSRRLIDDEFGSGTVLVSAISFWEVAMLCQKGRLQMVQSVLDWRADLLASGVTELPVGGDVGARAVLLQDLHSDPADRMIIASAVALGAVLVTADE